MGEKGEGEGGFDGLKLSVASSDLMGGYTTDVMNALSRALYLTPE